MSTARDRVLDMLARGVIEPAEAERLLAAVSPTTMPSWSATLINPFLRIGPTFTAGCGVVALLLSLYLARYGLRFDGFVDLHTASAAPFRTVLIDQVVAWPLPVLIFWLCSRLIAGAPARLFDLVGVVGFSRLPMTLVAPLVLLVAAESRSPSSRLVMTVVILVLVVQFVWLFQGVRHASGRSTSRSAVAFVVAVAVAEAVSKLLVAPRT